MLNRILEFKTQIKTYYLNFSLRANSEINKKYGSLKGFFEALQKETETVDHILWSFALLADEGARYLHHVENIPYRAVTVEEVGAVLAAGDITAVFNLLMECINGDREVLTQQKNV